MNLLFTILVVLIVIASILLTLVVLLQNGKGDGLATNFVAGNQTLGVRQTANILEKITWGLMAFVLVVSIISTFSLKTDSEGASRDSLTEEILNQGTTDEAPAFPVQVPAETE
ncbi:MAG: preprotein translocase subunit SecG [Firmicutes bacterium]|nr:preprotein translocase subunit SecG [Bacteroidales bacterium]MBR5740322.1 preprotein translocase subunit SecG [Bacillota bacterium]